ncbi:STY0301 family protein [Janthinobacterium sp. LM6]|uniref:STY0301 family protein n=1 Tax=Janthinobacterium sp. LM6 TaxID=1938606 RepID=UPI0012374363|nr:STY0301 family protein [Janthinobacterium sp. LM6]
MQHQRWLTGAACCLFPMLTQAAMPAAHACPESVPEASISLNAVPAGWTPYIGSPLYLSAAAPIDGVPERRGQLVPGGERKKKGHTILSYRLEGPYPDGKWLQCSYGAHGEVTLSKRMDDSVSLCEFTYRKGRKAGQNDIDIDCR